MLLVRHASAGERLPTQALDRERPLDREGRADASRLSDTLANFPVERIVTSPHLRCIETVAQLGRAWGLEVELRDELAPDASRTATLALLDDLPPATLVCTHREVIERLFDGEVTSEKGRSWLIDRRGGYWTPLAYLPPATRVEQPLRRPARVS
ncbi:MAG: histidine phosphatase family protein [Actinobacteria bacterium]|nr:histidine phosphatase family protein [Actinomycetota bacterium]